MDWSGDDTLKHELPDPEGPQPYYFDTPEAWEVGDGYTVVIRRHGRGGWVFRFLALDAWAQDTIHTLNMPHRDAQRRAAA